tara:strand:+ start:19 stop:669 length:651 start_codon:yes stop_codon:yes gene_type:complete
MKKLLAIVVLGLLWCNFAFSDDLPVQLFGIKINDDASNHVDISKGKISEKRPDIISYFENDDIEIKGLIKNSKLDGYYLRTNKENKIMIVAGYTTFKSIWSEDFQNKCSDSKVDFIKSLSNHYDFNAKKIKNNYYKNLSNNNRLLLYDSAELDYRKNFNKFTLQIMCTYTNYDDKVRSRLFISLMDQDYFKNSTLPLWEKINKFDDSVIKSNLTGF